MFLPKNGDLMQTKAVKLLRLLTQLFTMQSQGCLLLWAQEKFKCKRWTTVGVSQKKNAFHYWGCVSPSRVHHGNMMLMLQVHIEFTLQHNQFVKFPHLETWRRCGAVVDATTQGKPFPGCWQFCKYPGTNAMPNVLKSNAANWHEKNRKGQDGGSKILSWI